MSDSKDGKKGMDDTTRMLLIGFGSAAIGAVAYYMVNKHLKDRDDLMLMRVAEKQRELSSGGE
jgi:homospermidine synthase